MRKIFSISCSELVNYYTTNFLVKIGSLEVLFNLQLKRMVLWKFKCKKTGAKTCFFSCLIIKFDCLLNAKENVLREI